MTQVLYNKLQTDMECSVWTPGCQAALAVRPNLAMK
jgi:hypothetical protein